MMRFFCKILPSVFIITLISTLLISETMIFSEALSRPTPYLGKTFPAVYINIDMESIHRTEWQDVSITLNNTAEEYKFENLNARIRGRGNSSWNNFPPPNNKRPFRIRFGQTRTMLDSEHWARNWTFIAMHSDKSLMRDYSAYYLGTLLDGMYTSPFARFVDMYLNGKYWGVYMLCVQNNEITPGHVDLSYNSEPSLCEYLIQRDGRAPSGGVEDVNYVVVANIPYEIEYPRGDALTPSHVQYVKSYLTQVESATSARSKSVFSLINIDSFADYYIVQELYKNNDVGYASVFMQIQGQGENRRLTWGPLWDFDASAGNLGFWAVYNYGPHGIWVATANHWIRRLMEIPDVFGAVKDRYNQVRDVQLEQAFEHINYMAKEYQPAFDRNFERWSINVHIWHHPNKVRAIGTFTGQVEYLLNWLKIRREWLSLHFNCGSGLCVFVTEGVVEVHNHAIESFSLRGMYITDDKNDPFKWQLPNITLKTGEVLKLEGFKRSENDFNSSIKRLWLTEATGSFMTN